MVRFWLRKVDLKKPKERFQRIVKMLRSMGKKERVCDDLQLRCGFTIIPLGRDIESPHCKEIVIIENDTKI